MRTRSSGAAACRVVSLWKPWPAAFYVDPGLPDVITHPQRAVASRAAFWPDPVRGDAGATTSGSGRWRPPRHGADARREPPARRSRASSASPLTALALAGWFALAGAHGVALAARRRSGSLVALAPARRPRGGRLLRHRAAIRPRTATPSRRSSCSRPSRSGRSRSASPSTCSSSGADASASSSSRVARALPARLALPYGDLRLRLVSEWAFLRAGLVGRRRARRRRARRLGGPDRPLRGSRAFEELRRCLVEEKGATRRGDPRPDRPQRRARRARHGDRDEPRHGLGRRRRGAAPSGSSASYTSGRRRRSGQRLELRGRTVYLWERPPSPTQRQALFDCTY